MRTLNPTARRDEPRSKWRAPALALLAALAAGLAASRPALATFEPGAWNAPTPEQPAVVLVRNATIWTSGPQGTLAEADLLVRRGEVVAVGRDLSAPAGALVIDGAGKHVTPGLIDCHSHTAAQGDVNEGTNIVGAQVRIEDVVDPGAAGTYRQLAGGLTAANVLHGSSIAIGGQNAVVKLRWGASPREMLLAGAPPGIKFALGENPKQSNWNPRERRYPQTRQGIEQVIRQAFLAARDYRRRWEEHRTAKDRDRVPPRRDLQMEALVEILEGRRLVHAHSYRADEILMLLRLAEELGFRVATFQHVLEGYKVADEIAAHGAGASGFADWWAYKYEVIDAIPYNGALMTERGVVASFNSDSDELARRLNLEAAKAVRYGGLSEEEALKLVTLNPARQLGIASRVGSLEPGKDADFVVWSGHPLSTYSLVLETWIDGRKYFDREADLRARESIRAEREALMAKVKAAKEQKKEGEEGEEAEEKTEVKPEPPPGQPPPEQAPPEPPPQAQPSPPHPGPLPPAGGEGGRMAAAAEPLATRAASGREGAPSPAPAGLRGSPTEGRGEGPLPRARGESALASAAGLTAATATAADEPPLALVGATIHPVSGPPIEGGVLVIAGGKIAAVGPAGSEPPGAQRIDLAGKHLYPGFFHPLSQLGLVEIESVRGTVDLAEIGDFNPHLRAEVAVNADSLLLPVAMSGGVLTAHVHQRGGVFTGTSAVVRLTGWTWEEMTLAAPVGMHLRFPEVSPAGSGEGGEEQAEEQGKAMRELERFVAEARAYAQARRAAAAGRAPAFDLDPRLEAMVPVLDGKLPLFVHARTRLQIGKALDWTAKEGLTRRVLVSGPDAAYFAERLAAENVPVILSGVLLEPSRDFEPYDFAYAAPARLHAAGVRFAIAGEDASNARNVPFHAAMAAAFGLPQDEALASVTLRPAEILGLGDRLGSLDPGKDATFIVADGDPLEVRTRIERAWIAGREIDLAQDPQKRLYEKYRNRPRR